MTESEKQPKTMEYHRQVLQSRLDEDKYVPSTSREGEKSVMANQIEVANTPMSPPRI